MTVTPKKQAPANVPRAKVGAKRKATASKYVDQSSDEEEEEETEEEEESESEEEEPPPKKGKKTPGKTRTLLYFCLQRNAGMS